MPLQITEFWGFPCPGPGEGLAPKEALEAELQSHLWLEHEMSSVQRGQTTAEAAGYVGNPEAEPKQDSGMPVPVPKEPAHVLTGPMRQQHPLLSPSC